MRVRAQQQSVQSMQTWLSQKPQLPLLPSRHLHLHPPLPLPLLLQSPLMLRVGLVDTKPFAQHFPTLSLQVAFQQGLVQARLNQLLGVHAGK